MDYEPSRYGYNDYPAHRYHDYRYRTGDRYSGYRSGRHFDYGDELTYGPKGEPHIASYRFAPGESHMSQWAGMEEVTTTGMATTTGMEVAIIIHTQLEESTLP